MLALNLGKARGELSDVQFDRYCAELDQLPGQCDRFLNSTQADVRELAKYYRLASSFLLMGRSFNFPVALEGALKYNTHLKLISSNLKFSTHLSYQSNTHLRFFTILGSYFDICLCSNLLNQSG